LFSIKAMGRDGMATDWFNRELREGEQEEDATYS
jgi:hypothetical protein